MAQKIPNIIDMQKKQYRFDEAVFTYFVSTSLHPLFKFQKKFSKSNLIINYTSNTSVSSVQNDEETICIIGLCIDAYGEIDRKAIPQHLLENSHFDICRLINETKRLAGKFIILYENKNQLFVFGDATGSLPIFYNTTNKICFSSCDELVRKYFNYDLLETYVNIRNGSDFEQPMPFDITLCEQVKALLPNYYLNLNRNEPVRYFPTSSPPSLLKNSQIDETISRNIQLIDNIVAEYDKYCDIVCPLTGGNDSRAVLSLLKNRIPKLACYTFKHPLFKETTGDYYIPPKICQLEKLSHTSIHTMSVPDEYYTEIKEIMGEYYAKRTVSLAYTYNTFFRGKTMIEGKIIGGIGVHHEGNLLPDFFATPNYFRAKLHNYSKYIKPYIRKHVNEMKFNGNHNSIYDLFSLESRCGRWAAQGAMIYALAGINSLNIFNCRAIIEDWMRIPRRLRHRKIIHKTIFSQLSPELLEIPFNPGDRFAWMKSNAFFFLLATYGKYFIERVKSYF